MKWSLAFEHPFRQAARSSPEWMSHRLAKFDRRVALGSGAEVFPVVSDENPVLDITQGVRLFQDRVEDGGEIAGRGIDDAQDLGGRGLLLQCLARLGDQPRVLHRD